MCLATFAANYVVMQSPSTTEQSEDMDIHEYMTQSVVMPQKSN